MLRLGKDYQSTVIFWMDSKFPHFIPRTGTAPPGGGEEQGGEGGAEEAEGEHDAADDRHGAEAEHHLRQLLQGLAREPVQQQQVHVNLVTPVGFLGTCESIITR